jgi:hypothetical protein
MRDEGTRDEGRGTRGLGTHTGAWGFAGPGEAALSCGSAHDLRRGRGVRRLMVGPRHRSCAGGVRA